MQALLDLIAGRSEELSLDRAALQLARIEYPSLDVEPFVAILDSYAVELSERLNGRTGGANYVETANRYLFEELEFKGNSGNYYDPRNSCLNEVLSARTGIPITLAVVYLEIGRRLAQPVYGIGLPGHFLVQYHSPEYSAFIDVFNGGRVLNAVECFELARHATAAPLTEDARLLEPVAKRQIVRRMLYNLRGVYIHRKAYGRALRILDLLVASNPESAEEHKDRGLIHMQMRNLAAARADLETYLRLSQGANDRAEIERYLVSLRSSQAGLN